MIRIQVPTEATYLPVSVLYSPITVSCDHLPIYYTYTGIVDSGPASGGIQTKTPNITYVPHILTNDGDVHLLF